MLSRCYTNGTPSAHAPLQLNAARTNVVRELVITFRSKFDINGILGRVKAMFTGSIELSRDLGHFVDELGVSKVR